MLQGLVEFDRRSTGSRVQERCERRLTACHTRPYNAGDGWI